MTTPSVPISAPSSWRIVVSMLRTSRPAGWIVSAGLFRMGMAYGGASESNLTIALTVVLSFPFCLYLFGLNDLADAASDSVNPRKGSWIHGERSNAAQLDRIKLATIFSGIAVVAFVPFMPAVPGLLLSVVMLLGWAYSAHAVRLKEIPLVDGLTTAAIIVGLLGTGYAMGSTLTDIPVESYAVVPTIAGLHIFGTVVDVDSDRAAGHKTLAVRVGPRRTEAVALVLSLASVTTIPLLDYAPAIAAYLVLQAVTIAAALIVPRWMTARRVLTVVGTGGAITLGYMVLVYLV